MHIKLSESVAARRTIHFVASKTSDNTAYTSALSGTQLKVKKPGVAEATALGAAAHVANGMYTYEFAASELDTLGEVALRLAEATVWGDVYPVQVVAYDPNAATDLGLSSLSPATLLDEANGIETGLTVRQGLRLITAVLGGIITGAGTGTNTIRNVANSKNAVTATVDENGNRITITYNLT